MASIACYSRVRSLICNIHWRLHRWLTWGDSSSSSITAEKSPREVRQVCLLYTRPTGISTPPATVECFGRRIAPPHPALHRFNLCSLVQTIGISIAPEEFQGCLSTVTLAYRRRGLKLYRQNLTPLPKLGFALIIWRSNTGQEVEENMNYMRPRPIRLDYYSV